MKGVWRCNWSYAKPEAALNMMEEEDRLMESSRLLQLTSDDSDEASKKIPGNQKECLNEKSSFDS